jgi:N-acetylneuraminic acid mutarotase
MLLPREFQTATLLPDGDVLIAGGSSCGGTLCTLGEAELYHPGTGVFSKTGSMRHGRQSHAATLLADGNVLVSGGCADINFDFPCSTYTTKSAELYDPVTGTWARTGSMNVARLGHTLTALPGGGQALAAGGFNGNVLASAERYDAVSGQWKLTSGMVYARLGHTATPLKGGTVLVTGGCNGGACAAAEVYNPSTDTWSATGAMLTTRDGHTATVLPDGGVLAVGGCACTTAEVYTPGATPFVRLSVSSIGYGDQLVGTHSAGQALTVSNTGSRPLVVSGVSFSGPDPSDFSATSSCTIPVEPSGQCTITIRFSPTSTGTRIAVAGVSDNAPTSPQQVTVQGWGTGPGAWARTASVTSAVADPSATLLPDGSVLVAGGYSTYFDTVAGAEVFDARTATWHATGSMSFARAQHTGTLLPDGEVLVAGGCGYGSCSNGYATAGAELYDPVAGMFSPTGGMTIARGIHTATLLPNGKVLVTGGVTGCCPGPALRSAELYDPVTGSWTRTGSMAVGRELQTATLLRDGRVLIAGGCSTNLCGGYLATAELYDPRTGRFRPTGSMTTPRAGHTATLLPNGDVLVAGGQSCGFPCPGLASAELYHPGTGTWTAVGSMETPRSGATATLLKSGQVLVTGGCAALCGAPGTTVVATAELFDPARGTWRSTGSLHDLRVGHVAALLADGSVLVAGGFDQNSNPLSSAELYTPPLPADVPAREAGRPLAPGSGSR